MRISCGTRTGEVMCLWGPDCSLPASSHKLIEGDASCWGEKRKYAYVQTRQVQIECKKISLFFFFTMKTVKQWSRLSGEVIQSPSL